MILLNSCETEPGAFFPEHLVEESGVGFILFINLCLLTGNFFFRWSEELNLLWLSYITLFEKRFCLGFLFACFCCFVLNLCPNSVFQGLKLKSACEVPIWDQRFWSKAMSMGSHCAFSSEQVSLMPGSCSNPVGLRGMEEGLKGWLSSERQDSFVKRVVLALGQGVGDTWESGLVQFRIPCAKKAGR